ncbi:MAG: pseudouridine synthase, partial [Bilophila wadsworthia]
MPEPLQVTAAEAGQKLLQFLSRRFEEPQSVLHRWIRTGQVRINGGRAKPFDRVELNDEIRVPPFAGAGTKAERVPASSGGKELPPIVAETADVIVFCKPSGLPVHPGTGHTDSLTTRLEAAFAGSPFIPAPVHRLDRDTSGLLLVGKTYAAVRRLSDALAAHD